MLIKNLEKLGFLFFVLILQINANLLAQVTIGADVLPQPYSMLEIISNDKGGLRLPQLSSENRDALTTASFKADPKAQGLAIFNTTTKCFEYWNGSRWVSLCKGDADIYFVDGNGVTIQPWEKTFVCGGDIRGPFITHSTPECTGVITPYEFTVVVGEDYTYVNVIDRSIGKFEISMLPNTMARSRTAIVRVTNNCTTEYKEFLFIQESCGSTLCDNTILKPEIHVTNQGNMCASGATYMYILKNFNPSATYIWALNDSELTAFRGKTYCVAEQSGNYRLYVNAIGCESNASDVVPVTISSTQAPLGVGYISATNNGVICGNTPVYLTAYTVPSTGTIAWFKNGIEQPSKTGNTISLSSSTDAGDWFAVMKNGNCYSLPSNIITVRTTTGNSLAAPQILVNGSSFDGTPLCGGGNIELSIGTTYTNAVTVSWYNNTVLLGTGTPYTFALPASGTLALRCVVHDNTGIYCDAESTVNINISGSAPARPAITGILSICGATPATLSTQAVSGATYTWFRNGTVISGVNSNTYQTSQTGNYQVQVAVGSCVSSISATATVQLSALPIISFLAPQTSVLQGETVTYMVSASNSPTRYLWEIAAGDAIFLDGDNAGERISNTTDPIMRVQFGSSDVKLHCTATNYCGNSNPAAVVNVNVKTACTPPQIASTTVDPPRDANYIVNVMQGTAVSISVVVTGTTPITYTWYKDGTQVATTTVPFYQFSANTSGSYSVIASNSCGSTNMTGVGNINVTRPSSPGTGKVNGQDCFDVNNGGNSNSTCGQTNSRIAADFSKSYNYTFTNNGTGNTNLRWLIEENPQNAIIDYAASSINPVSGTLQNGGVYSISLKFKESLRNDARGTTDVNAYKLTIHAIYTNGGTDYDQKMTVTIKDCRCSCGAKTASGGWLAFMCHNLGANESQDPFTGSNISGDYYQWGRFSDGHEKAGSATTSTRSSSNRPGSSFITGPNGQWLDWCTSGITGNNRWSDSQKGENDPCPAGWKVPSAAQWASLFGTPVADGNTRTTPENVTVNKCEWTGSGIKVGDALFLPAAGQRSSQVGLTGVGIYLNYWSSTPQTYQESAHMLSYDNNYGRQIVPTNIFTRLTGGSIRCVQE